MTLHGQTTKAEAQARSWASGRLDDVDQFALDYAAYLEDLPTDRYPDLPPLTPEQFADEHAGEYDLPPVSKPSYTWAIVAIPVTAVVGGALSIAAQLLSGTSWPVDTLRVALAVCAVAGGLWLAIIDAREHRVPNAIVYPLGVVVLGLTLSLATASHHPEQLLWAPLAGVALGACYFLLGLIGAVGFGDVKLAVVIGIALSWFGWPALLAATALAYVLALPHAIVLATRKRRSGLAARLPFGPYMIAGALLTATWWWLVR